MSPLLLFLVGAVPSFALGALARPYIDRLIEEAHMPTTTESTPAKPRQRWRRVNLIPILLAFATITSCAALVYTVNSDRQSDKRLADLASCLTEWSRESSGATLARSDAAQARDDALVNSKKAMRAWVRRILDGETLDNSPAIRQAALQYIAQTGIFIKASEDYDRTRTKEPVVLFDDAYCAQVAARKRAAQ